MKKSMRPSLKFSYLSEIRALVILFALLLFYPDNSFAQSPGACTSYLSACPGEAKVWTSPPGCTQDGYPAFNGPADAGSIDGAPCPGQVWSDLGTNTYPSSKAASSAVTGSTPFETDQGDGASGYECFELAVRYWKYRFAIDINQICKAQGDCSAQDLQYLKWPSAVTVYPMPQSVQGPTPYTPVCGDLVSYNNGAQHVDVVTSVSGSGPSAQVTTLNQNTGGWNPWSTGPVTNPIYAGTTNFSYIHVNANTSSGTSCAQSPVASNSNTNTPARSEPFALSAFNTGINVLNDERGNVDIFTHNTNLSMNGSACTNFDPNSWVNLQDDAAYDPVGTLDSNQMINLFYMSSDFNVWHDFQTLNGWSGCLPKFPGGTNIIQQWKWIPAQLPPNRSVGHFAPAQLIIPTNVVPTSNLNVVTDSAGLVHIIFFGAYSAGTGGTAVVNLYESVQAAPSDEYNTANVGYTQWTPGAPLIGAPNPPVFNLYKPFTAIVKGGTQQLYCSTGSCPANLGTVSTFLQKSVPSGYPTILNNNGTLYVFYRSDDIDLATNNRGSIWYLYRQGGGSWSTPQQIKITVNPGTSASQTIIPVATSNIAAAVNPDGRMELFYRGSDQALWHLWQTAPGALSWSMPASLGDVVTSDPVALYNNKVPLFLQVMQVFYRDSVGDIKTLYRYHNSETISSPPTPAFTGTWSCRDDIVNSTSDYKIGNLPNNFSSTVPTNVYSSYPQVSIPGPAPFVNSRVAIGFPPTGQLSAFFVGANSSSENSSCNTLHTICTGSAAVSANSIWHMWQNNTGVNQDCVKGPQSVGTAAAIETTGQALTGQSGQPTDSPTGWMGGYQDLDFKTGTACAHVPIIGWVGCTDHCPQGCGLKYEIPFPQSIGGQEVEAATTYGTSVGTPGEPNCATDAYIQTWEGYRPWCYGDGSGGTPWPSAGNETFGIGTCIDSSCSTPPAGGWVCPAAACTGSLCGTWAATISGATPWPTGVNVCNIYTTLGGVLGSAPPYYSDPVTQNANDAALTCANDYLNLYLEAPGGEWNRLYGTSPSFTGGMVNSSKVSQMSACQMNALADYGYQYGLGSPCVQQVVTDINNGNFTQARNDFMDCPGYVTRRQGDQAEWDATPPQCTSASIPGMTLSAACTASLNNTSTGTNTSNSSNSNTGSLGGGIVGGGTTLPPTTSCASTGGVGINPAPTGPAAPAGGWSVVFADDFNAPLGTGPGQDNFWQSQSGNGNNQYETEVYAPGQISIQNGTMVLSAIYTPGVAPAGSGYVQRNYTSGRVITPGFTWLPGGGQTWAFETVVQFPPQDNNIFNAFWTSTQNSWTNERDFIEGHPNNSMDTDWIWDTGCCGDTPPLQQDYYLTTLPFDPSAAYHRYTYFIFPDQSWSYYIDGQLQTWAGGGHAPARSSDNTPMQLILNYAMDETTWTSGAHNFLIDSVAVYEDTPDVGRNTSGGGIAPGTAICPSR